MILRQAARALALLALGASASILTSSASIAQNSDDRCSGCKAIIQAPLIEFVAYLLPTGSSCSFRHNFTWWDGYCYPEPVTGCEEYPCRWEYTLECIGMCSSSSLESGTIWYTPNGPLAAPTPCNTVQPLPPVQCGQSMSTIHYAWTTITQSGVPQLQTRFNRLDCTYCVENQTPVGTTP